MKWTEPRLRDLMTREILFYSPDHATTCSNWTKAIGVYTLPDIDEKSYWEYQSGKWTQKANIREQSIDEDTNIFDTAVLDQIRKAPSNILFCRDSIVMSGIVHFTDYNNRHVFESLYHNIFEFENNLRRYLSEMGYTNEDIIHFIERDGTDFYTRKKVDRIERKIEQEDLPELHLFDFKDILLFAVEPWKGKKHQLLEQELNMNEIEQIGWLRNTIMHSKNFVGTDSNGRLHNFDRFETFITQITVLRKAFRALKRLRYYQTQNARHQFNYHLMDMLSKFNIQELRAYFTQRQY